MYTVVQMSAVARNTGLILVLMQKMYLTKFISYLNINVMFKKII